MPSYLVETYLPRIVQATVLQASGGQNWLRKS